MKNLLPMLAVVALLAACPGGNTTTTTTTPTASPAPAATATPNASLGGGK